MPLPNPVYDTLTAQLRRQPRTWLVTGAAGFIGSHLVHALLNLNQRVLALDNFSAGKRSNLDDVRISLPPQNCQKFELIEGDIRDLQICKRACVGVDFVLHQAALCSVPASIADPIATHASNV